MLLIVLMAGCLGGAGPESSSPASRDPGAAGTASNASKTGTLVHAEDEVNWSASTGPNACLGPSLPSADFCVGARSWAGYGVDLGSAPDNSTVVLDGSLDLAWDPKSAATEKLRIRLVLCEAECDTSDRVPANATGSSPLRLEIDRVRTLADLRVHVIVDVPSDDLGPIQTRLSTNQPFTATGKLTATAA